MSEVSEIDLIKCKTRSTSHSDFCIADGDEKHSFLAVSVGIKEGRSDEEKQKLSDSLVAFLENKFSEKANLQITVEVLDISRSGFSKRVVTA